MYGNQLPGYAKVYQSAIRTRDAALRLRWSLDYPGQFVVERRKRWVGDFPVHRGTDRAVQLNQGYCEICRILPRDLPVLAELLPSIDLQRLGAATYTRRIEEAEDRRAAAIDQSRLDDFTARAHDAYNIMAVRDKRRVYVP